MFLDTFILIHSIMNNTITMIFGQVNVPIIIKWMTENINYLKPLVYY